MLNMNTKLVGLIKEDKDPITITEIRETFYEVVDTINNLTNYNIASITTGAVSVNYFMIPSCTAKPFGLMYYSSINDEILKVFNNC